MPPVSMPPSAPPVPPSPSWAAQIVLGLLTLGYAVVLVVASGFAVIRAVERAGGGSATGWDKVMHLAAFAVLGFLLAEFLLSRQRRPAVGWSLAGALLVGTGYAAFHEGIQAFLPGFVFNPLDFLADVVGLAVGSGAAALWQRSGIRLWTRVRRPP